MSWGWVGCAAYESGVVGFAENKATQPSLAGAWAELGKKAKCRVEDNDNIIGEDSDQTLDDFYDLVEHVGKLHSGFESHFHLCSVTQNFNESFVTIKS